MRKGQIFSEIIFKIANVIIVVVIIGIIASLIFPGFETVFREVDTSQEVQELVDMIDREVCGESMVEGTIPPSRAAKDDFVFHDVERIDASGNEFEILMEGADETRTVEVPCDDIDEIILCEDEEKEQDIESCEPPGDTLSAGTYSFEYYFDGRKLTLMVEREVEDHGPFIYYLSRDAGDYGLRAVSVSENIVYKPENEYAGATTLGDYEGRGMSFTGDLRMLGYDNSIVIGNRTNIFRYDINDFSTESVRYDQDLSIYDLGGVGNIRDGEIQETTVDVCDGRLATEENIEDLARIIWVEARGSNAGTETYSDIRIAIGYTVFRTMMLREQTTIRKPGGAITRYGHGTGDRHIYYEQDDRRWTDITEEEYGRFKPLAEDVLNCNVPDPSDGASHYYSPRSMPHKNWDGAPETGSLEEIENTYFDVLPRGCSSSDISPEYVTETWYINGEERTNYIPPWGNPELREHDTCYYESHETVEMATSQEEEYNFKFFRAPQFEDLEVVERDFGEWGGNEVTFINGTVSSDSRQVCAYNFLSDRALNCVSNEQTCEAETIGDIGNPEGDGEKVFFANSDPYIRWWDGKNHNTGSNSCEPDEEDTIGFYEVADFETGQSYDIVDLSTFASISSGSDDQDKVVVARDPSEDGGRYFETHLAYLDFRSVQNGVVDINILTSETEVGGNIVSVGQVFDNKIPFNTYNQDEEMYSLKFYDITNQEVVEVEAASEPVRVGAFIDAVGR